jgi:ParB family transcriptional regulator, chromosome partitioning protein
MTITTINLADIKPAPYNPRVIREKQFEMLKQSVTELGVIMPILINSKNDTLIAGHQRTKAMQAVGIIHAPAVLINGIEIGDEIKFNQLHNAIEKEPNTLATCHVQNAEGFEMLSHKDFDVPESNPVFVREICQLLTKYGNSLSCIVCENVVYMGNNYVKACKLLNLDVLTYHLPKEKLEIFQKYFSADYGEYNYERIKRDTFVQGMAQLHRSIDRTDGKRENRSRLYEHHILPYLTDKDKNMTIFDFGCGKATYINMLAKTFKNAIGLEFFNNNGSEIIVDKGHNMIDRLLLRLKKNPQFDLVICDSVLNSVDSQKAEDSILGCLNLFCKPGGTLFISGRTIEAIERRHRMQRDATTGKRFLEFTDSEGLTGNFRKGKWYFQKYHKRDKLEKALHDYGFEIEKITWAVGNDGFYVKAKKVHDLPKQKYIDAVTFEFNLPLPNDKSYNRHKDVLEVLGL